MSSLLAAFAFYTCLPIPPDWQLDFARIARWGAVVGVSLGGILGCVDLGLDWLGMPLWTRSMLIVALGVAITGGLHLDGAMDTADGLAVQQPERRLAVMADSATGAFGAMVAVVIIGLKLCAIAEITDSRLLAFALAGGWSRWGQIIAIAWYPYLKAEGKGAFHKQGIQLPQDVLLGLTVMLGLTGLQIYLQPATWSIFVGKSLGCIAIALSIGYYFHRRLGGHTGDTYGAVVEWTEVLILCLLTL